MKDQQVGEVCSTWLMSMLFLFLFLLLLLSLLQIIPILTWSFARLAANNGK